MGLMESYKLAAESLLWAPFAILGMFGSFMLAIKRQGTGNVTLSAVWREWKSSTATILGILIALLLTAAMGQLNLAAAILIGLSGDQALNKWTVDQ